MKPSKRIMCPDCGRQKMLFETERKANDFIKWNGSEMEHGESLRAYYCPSCCGWHVSHKKHRYGYDNRTENLISAFERTKKSSTKIDRLIHYADFEKEAKQLENRATEIYNDIPEEVKAKGQKSAIKRYLDIYFPNKGIDDKSGRLRGVVYKVFEKDLYKRFNN